jgi:hypothetical protein
MVSGGGERVLLSAPQGSRHFPEIRNEKIFVLASKKFEK